MIELSRTQINGVISEAAKGACLSGGVGGMGELEFRVFPAQLDDRRCSRSFLLGLMVLASFPADGLSRSVTDVARELEIAYSTARRYISTLVEVGLLERDPESREYRLARRSPSEAWRTPRPSGASASGFDRRIV